MAGDMATRLAAGIYLSFPFGLSPFCSVAVHPWTETPSRGCCRSLKNHCNVEVFRLHSQIGVRPRIVPYFARCLPQLAAMRHDLYFSRLIHHSSGKPCEGNGLWTAGDLVRGAVVRFLRTHNRQGCDVFLPSMPRIAMLARVTARTPTADDSQARKASPPGCGFPGTL